VAFGERGKRGPDDDQEGEEGRLIPKRKSGKRGGTGGACWENPEKEERKTDFASGKEDLKDS